MHSSLSNKHHWTKYIQLHVPNNMSESNYFTNVKFFLLHTKKIILKVILFKLSNVEFLKVKLTFPEFPKLDI